MGKRSILEHFMKLKQNFDTFVEESFNSFFMDFVTPSVALDILMSFLAEGMKIVFRFTYAVLKLHKNQIKNVTQSS
jgi:hypothetical protein